MSKAAEKPLTEPYSKTYKPVSLYITNLNCSSLECLTICSTSTSTRHISLTTKCLSTGTCVAYGLLLAELYATCGQVSILTKNTGQNRASLIPGRMARFSGWSLKKLVQMLWTCHKTSWDSLIWCSWTPWWCSYSVCTRLWQYFCSSRCSGTGWSWAVSISWIWASAFSY